MNLGGIKDAYANDIKKVNIAHEINDTDAQNKNTKNETVSINKENKTKNLLNESVFIAKNKNILDRLDESSDKVTVKFTGLAEFEESKSFNEIICQTKECSAAGQPMSIKLTSNGIVKGKCIGTCDQSITFSDQDNWLL